MRILDRYILRSVLGILLVCLLTFLALYIVSDILSHLQDILKQKIGLDILIRYCLSFLPVIVVQAAPFSCLLGVLYTFGKLNRNNEIIAMRASGLSILQISRTLIAFGIITSLVIFWVKDRCVPQAMSESQKIRDIIDKGAKKGEEQNRQVIANLSMYGLKNRLYFVNKFHPASSTMEGITILEHDEHQNIVKKIVANKGVYKDGVWRFYQCITYDFDENGQVKEEPNYSEDEIMNISETPRDFLNQRQRPDYMTIAQIEDYIWKLSKSGATGVIKNLKVDLYQRYTEPLTSFIIILLAIPFSLMIRKRGAGIFSLGISIIIGFFYYVFNAISIALGYAGILPPLLAVSLSHGVIFCLSVYLIATLK
ncbi:MAG: LptF/LptG family permease [Candidatus Omnitrophica bacterium]|nr:LptF/LptG family permease [Candidatus Omnitrophota bacterium]